MLRSGREGYGILTHRMQMIILVHMVGHFARRIRVFYKDYWLVFNTACFWRESCIYSSYKAS